MVARLIFDLEIATWLASGGDLFCLLCSDVHVSRVPVVSRIPRYCIGVERSPFRPGMWVLAGAEQGLLPRPVVFGHGFVRLDTHAHYLLHDSPPLRVARFSPQLLDLINKVCVDDRVQLRAAFCSAWRGHNAIGITP